MNRRKKIDFAHNLNVPGGGPQGPPIKISEDEPIYSSYTGELIGYGGIDHGVKVDAPKGEKNYGDNYHAIIFNPVNKTFLAHDRHHEKVKRERDDKPKERFSHSLGN